MRFCPLNGVFQASFDLLEEKQTNTDDFWFLFKLTVDESCYISAIIYTVTNISVIQWLIGEEESMDVRDEEAPTGKKWSD